MSGPDLNDRNKSAWNALYASTEDAVWGREPAGYVRDFLPKPAELPIGGILDAAAGEGRNLPPLLTLGRPVTACDASAAALAKVAPPLAARIETVICDLARIPRPGGSFALILANDVIETLPDPGPVLVEFARLLAPGGWLLLNIPDQDDGIAGVDMIPAGAGWMYRGRYYYRFYSQAESARLLAAAGLETVRDERVEWMEASHPQFREGSHAHRSRVILARRPVRS